MHQIVVSDITVDVVRKDIKNLHLAVYPPKGRVRIAVPEYVDDEAIRLAVIAKLSWIKKQQQQFREQERQTERLYVSGESHYFQGNRYLLRVIEQDVPPSINIRNKKVMDLKVRPGSTASQRADVVRNWYREYLKSAIPPMVEKWQPVMGVKVSEWRIKQMKTKWGSCNIEAQRIWLNLELAKKPNRCLEYIVVHEMVHLLERHHNDRFTQLMDSFLPKWRYMRDELNQEPLGFESWDY